MPRLLRPPLATGARRPPEEATVSIPGNEPGPRRTRISREVARGAPTDLASGGAPNQRRVAASHRSSTTGTPSGGGPGFVVTQIPAGAGELLGQVRVRPCSFGGHPRGCGGVGRINHGHKMHDGSFPRVRGKRDEEGAQLETRYTLKVASRAASPVGRSVGIARTLKVADRTPAIMPKATVPVNDY